MSVRHLTVLHAKELTMLDSASMMLLIVLTSPVMAEEPTACSLLTSGEIEAVTGGTVSATEPMQLDDIPSDHNRTVTVVGCL